MLRFAVCLSAPCLLLLKGKAMRISCLRLFGAVFAVALLVPGSLWAEGEDPCSTLKIGISIGEMDARFGDPEKQWETGKHESRPRKTTHAFWRRYRSGGKSLTAVRYGSDNSPDRTVDALYCDEEKHPRFDLAKPTPLLSSLDPNDGRSVLVGVLTGFGPSRYMGDFYVDNPQTLAELKERWVSIELNVDYRTACFYEMYVYVLNDGKLIEKLSFNVSCDYVVTNYGQLTFPGKHFVLPNWKKKVKPAHTETRHFETLTEARDYYAAVQKLPLYLYADTPEWETNEGKFSFSMTCSKVPSSEEPQEAKCRRCDDEILDYDLRTACVAEVERQLKKWDEKEAYTLSNPSVRRNGSISVEISANRSLYEKILLKVREVAECEKPDIPSCSENSRINPTVAEFDAFPLELIVILKGKPPRTRAI